MIIHAHKEEIRIFLYMHRYTEPEGLICFENGYNHLAY